MKNRKIIGTDASLKECKKMGYLMMQYTGIKVNPNRPYLFFSYNHDDFEVNPKDKKISFSILCNLLNLIELYKIYKEGVDEMQDWDFSLDPRDYDSFEKVLDLADSLNSYCGLDKINTEILL